MNKYRYDVCLDTNIVIKLATTDKVFKNALLDDDNKKEIKFLQSTGTQKPLTDLYFAIAQRQIHAIVTPTVLEELEQGVEKHGYEALEYLYNSNIEILTLSKANETKYYAYVDMMAEQYSRKIKSSTLDRLEMIENDRKHKNNDPFNGKKKYTTLIWKNNPALMPQNDAIILAESSALKLPLVTENTKDFINYHRQALIAQINQQIFHLPIGVKPLTTREMMEIFTRKHFDYFTTLDRKTWKTQATKNREMTPTD